MGMKCENCGNKLYVDSKSGEIVCKVCGFVSQKYVLFEGVVYER
jgi:transcription initiation factor TFIIIB Brf1 subunit/transcription initiation factor TFIIB